MTRAEQMAIWTIYRSGSHFVARNKWIDSTGVIQPCDGTLAEPRIDGLRETLSGVGLVCVGRQKDDDPEVVEVWL
jgi:hypothetical protein